MNEEIKYKIINALRNESVGASINEIAKKVSISRITARYYLKILEYEGIVKCKNIGKAKAYKLTEKGEKLVNMEKRIK